MAASQEDVKIARDLYAELRGITAELKGQENEITKSRKAFKAFEDVAQKFKLNQEDISKLNDKELKDLSKKLNSQLAIAKQEGQRLINQTSIGQQIADEVAELRELGVEQAGINDFVAQSLRLTEELTDEQRALVAATFDEHAVVQDINNELEKELAIRNEANRLMGVAGGLLTTLNKFGGQFAGALGLDQVEADMAATADQIARGNREAGFLGRRMTVLGAGISSAFGSLRETLTDPSIILGAIAKSYKEYSKSAKEIRQETGVSATVLADVATQAGTFNSSLVSSIDAAKTIASLTQQTGMNVAATFSPQTIGAATDLATLSGLSADATANMALRAEVLGDNLGEARGQAIAVTQEFASSGKGAFTFKSVLADAGKASSSLALSIKGGQEGLVKAAAGAAALGLNLAKAEGIADNLLNFEESIANELEAELLTGQSLNLEKARTAALNNDIATLTEEIGNNQAIMDAFSSGNRIQQEAIAKSLGMQKEDVANMIFAQQKAAGLTAAQAAAAAGISEEEATRLSTQEQITKSIEKMTAAFAPVLDIVASLLSNSVVLYSTLGLIAFVFAAKIRKSILESVDGMRDLASGATDFVKNTKEGGIKEGIKGALGMGGDGTKKAADATKGADAKQGMSVKGFLKGLGDGLASIGKQFGQVVKGGLALGIVGVILGGSFALAMKMVENVDPVQMIAFSGALAIFGATAAIIGKLGGQVMQGAAALLVMGVALIPAAFAFSLLEGLDVKALMAFSIALPLLALAAAGLGFVAPFIMAGAAALAVLGLALIPAALGFSMLQGLEIDTILSFATGVGVLATMAAGLGFVAPFIMLGSAALATLGLAMIPLSIGFERMAEANTEGLVASIAQFAGLAPGLLATSASLFALAGGLTAVGIAGITALPVFAALAGLGTVATGIAGLFGGGEEGEGGDESPNAALEAKLDELNKNVVILIGAVNSGGTVSLDGNKVGTALSMGASRMA